MNNHQTARSDELPTEVKISFLQRPEAYPEGPSRVDTIETHMSWVFLTDEHAYKLKKPVRSALFDFRTLPARHYNCLEEVRLNCALAPAVYLGVVPLTVDRTGTLRLGRGGRIIEWLVKMRRLPAERTLEHAIRSRVMKPDDVRRVAQVLTAFYGRSAPLAVDPADHRVSFARTIRELDAKLRREAYSLPEPMIACAVQAGTAFLDHNGSLLEARARSIVEAHGDLRPEHIYLCEQPLIVDRLEFSFALRALDPVDELAYLAMECERLGAPQAGPILLEIYCAATGDTPGGELIAFYKVFRAMVRAHLSAAHIDDPSVGNPEKWRQRAIEYLCAAHRSVERLR